MGVPRHAQAQIYSWRDGNGVLILSDKPQAGSTRIQQAVTARVAPPQATTANVGSPLLLNIGTAFEGLIRQHSSLQAIRADLVRAVIQVESGFNPRAVSPKGAKGLMQLMPATAAQYGVLDPFNPAENIRAGVRYLRTLLDKYNDNEQLALAAYNAGPKAVDRYGSKIPPYKETQRYVQKISILNASRAPTNSSSRIYKTVEIVDGQPVLKYTNVKPSAGSYQEVRR
jgi:soluble lytic murein transglycosylase-like protein